MKTESKSISVILPAYNEEATIKDTVTTIHDFLSSTFNNFEIIVVNDGSSDKTAEIVNNMFDRIKGLKLLTNSRNRGKGYSVRKGVLSASYEYVMFSDSDLSTPIDEVLKCMNYFTDGVDIVLGSRALKESNIIKYQGFLRRSMGKIFNLLIKIFLFRGINDTQCGFKCFTNKAAKELFSLQRLDRFCFDAEILYLAGNKGYKVKEVPVKWLNRENSRVSMVKDSINMFLDIFRIKINAMKGYYGN